MKSYINAIIEEYQGDYSFPDRTCLAIADELIRRRRGKKKVVKHAAQEALMGAGLSESAAIKAGLKLYKTKAKGYRAWADLNGLEVLDGRDMKPDDIYVIGGDVLMAGQLVKAGKRNHLMAFATEAYELWSWCDWGIVPIGGEGVYEIVEAYRV